MWSAQRVATNERDTRGRSPPRGGRWRRPRSLWRRGWRCGRHGPSLASRMTTTSGRSSSMTAWTSAANRDESTDTSAASPRRPSERHTSRPCRSARPRWPPVGVHGHGVSPGDIGGPALDQALDGGNSVWRKDYTAVAGVPGNGIGNIAVFAAGPVQHARQRCADRHCRPARARRRRNRPGGPRSRPPGPTAPNWR